jgi:hypothetical protein
LRSPLRSSAGSAGARLDDEQLRADRQKQQDKAWLIYKTEYSMLVLVAALDYVDIALKQSTVVTP